MLKSLFKPSWKSNSVDKRLRFIEGVTASDPSQQTILEKLASNDTDASVRHAAMAKINDPQVLLNFRFSQVHSDSKQAAETALRNLIQSDEFTVADSRKFINRNPKAKNIVAKYCPDPELRDELLLSLEELEQAKVIADVQFSATRVKIAEKLESLGPLEIARKHLKGRDKSAEKIIKSKIDLIHAQQKQDLENAALATTIREEMESLSRYIAWSDEIRVKFLSLTKRWDGLDFVPSGTEKSLYQAAFAQVEANVRENEAFVLAEQSQTKIVSRLESMCFDVAAYSLDQLIEQSHSITAEMSDLKSRWSKDTSVVSPSESLQQRYLNASQSIVSAVDIGRCVNNLRECEADVSMQKAKATLVAIDKSAWSNNLPALSVLDGATAEAKTVLNAVYDERKKAKESLDNLHKRINRLFGIANRGDISRAQRELAAVTKAAGQYEGKERKALDERIEQATESVNKMGDWKDFALEPKLIDLCDQMEALASIEVPNPDKQATEIKKLQQAWKAFGSSAICDTYWPRFKEAGDKAYEPCSVYFKQRRETQRENLKKRDPLVNQMNTLFESTDWDAKPDFKSVEDSVSQIMQQWKKIKDVEHGPGQKQWNKLIKAKDQISDKLTAEYDKNIADKHGLTAQLEQMLEQGVTEQSLDKLQFIQNKWKQVGVTRRKEDQAAWLKFKTNSDAVYQKIQDLRQAKRSVEDEQINAYKQIHTQILALAKSTQDLTVSDKEFEALEAQYNDLPALPSNLPEKVIERLNKEYAQACRAYDGAKERLDKQKIDNEIATLASKAKLCLALEQLPESAEPSEIAALEDEIAKLELSNKSYAKRFAMRLERARELNREEFSVARRLLLIESEILLDVQSPEEDKELRLKIQLEKMKEQGLGHAAISASKKVADLKIEWLCMPGAEAKLQAAFDQRFEQLLKQGEPSSG